MSVEYQPCQQSRQRRRKISTTATTRVVNRTICRAGRSACQSQNVSPAAIASVTIDPGTVIKRTVGEIRNCCMVAMVNRRHSVPNALPAVVNNRTEVDKMLFVFTADDRATSMVDRRVSGDVGAAVPYVAAGDGGDRRRADGFARFDMNKVPCYSENIVSVNGDAAPTRKGSHRRRYYRRSLRWPRRHRAARVMTAAAKPPFSNIEWRSRRLRW